VKALSVEQILELWERGAAMGNAERALAILTAAFPDRDPAALAALPLGVRDRALLAVRSRTLGPCLTSLDRCPACGETIELTLYPEEIGLSEPESDAAFAPAASRELELLGHRVRLRPVTAGDMVAAERADDAADARKLLLDRVLEAVDDLMPDGLDAPIAAAAEQALEALDPAADIHLAVACPACGAEMERQFDAAAFFWQELVGRATRLLREVAELARAYHWSEAEILALSPGRRAFYLSEARA
jgi:hypothetical protein